MYVFLLVWVYIGPLIIFLQWGDDRTPTRGHASCYRQIDSGVYQRLYIRHCWLLRVITQRRQLTSKEEWHALNRALIVILDLP